jgi:hypothetical protein
MMAWYRGAFAALIGTLLLAVAGPADAASAVNAKVLSVDLAPKIAAAANRRERFAVDVPHAASVEDAGNWETTGETSTWRYAVRIPTAVSLSFHARTFELPPGAMLTVTANDGTRAVYTRESVRGELWSRIQKGDALSFELRVASVDRAQVQFALASLQAGYRALGGVGADHPAYRKTLGVSQTATASTCVRNFACEETAQNSRNARATAAIVLDGVALCSATLVNNLRNDGTAYLLTARHCQVNPSGGLVVYWDAVSPCGSVLGSVFDTRTAVDFATARTAFEQQDVWLLRLDSAISAAQPYFAGWDATGGTFVGGYSPHHAFGRARQYAGWFGQAALVTLPANTLGVGYDSTYWGVVNAVGSVGSGASGGGLFNPEHRLVGIASLAQQNAGGEGTCPAAAPPAPDSETAVALYNSLAAVWQSNADTTSFTNPVTLQSLLDPDDTGARISDGFEMLTGVSFYATSGYALTGQSITLKWSSGTGVTCVASRGAAGDGWSGSRPGSGSFDVIEYEAGVVRYDLRCTDGTRYVTRTAQVIWNESVPSLLFSGATGVFLGGAANLTWSANVQPCVASGGVSGDGWAGGKPARGSQDVSASQAGDVAYTVACGSGERSVTGSVTVTYSTPYATLQALSNNMRIGSVVTLVQTGGGTSCQRTGGAPGDGWTGSTAFHPARVTSTTPGTYRYTLTCNGGPTPAVASVDLTFTNAAPTATIVPSRTSAEVFALPVSQLSPEQSIEFAWNSNIAPCQVVYDGPGSEDGAATPAMDQQGRGTVQSGQIVTGTYVYTVRCVNGADSVTASTTVQFVPQAPHVYMDVQGERIAANEPVSIGWNSNTGPCIASGGAPGDGWAGSQGSQGGFVNVTLTTPGTYTYTMTCGTAANTVSRSVDITLGASVVSFEPHEIQAFVGRGVLLRWAGTVGPCTLTGDWAGNFASSGGNVVVSSGVGTRTYGVRCGTTSFVEATTQVTFRPLPIVDISASRTQAAVNTPVTLNWTSSNATSCQVEGSGSSDWSGTLPTSGSRVVTRSSAGSFGFYINCDDVLDAVVVEFTDAVSSPPPQAEPPTLSLSIDHATRVSGESVTLTWTTTHAASCRGTGGVNGDGWAGVLPVSGTRKLTITGSGTLNWGMTCSGAPPAAIATVSATYSIAPSNPPPSNGGGGSGGGGSLDSALIAILWALLSIQAARRLRRVPRSMVTGQETAT